MSIIDNITKLFLYRKRLIKPHIDRVLSISNMLSYIISLLMILTVVYDHGFIVSEREHLFISDIYTFVWCIFFIDTTLQLLFNFSEVRQEYRVLSWLLCALLYLSLVPMLCYPPAESSWLYGIWAVLDSAAYSIIMLSTLSILRLSNGVILLMKKSVNPSVIFSISFFVFILIGTGMLMMPRSTYEGISFVDALFTATSAVCVTGLTTVDVATTFTTIGQLFIMVLIQIGGLGVMTLTSFFAMFFMGNASLNNQVMMCDMVSSKSMNSLLKTLLYILGFTIIIELAGALFIFLTLRGTLDMTLQGELAFSLFHSISAFCNAGFSTLPNSLGGEILMSHNNPFYIVISTLIILGGLGFPILVNLYESSRYHILRIWECVKSKTGEPIQKRVHLYDLNTRIVLRMTGILLVGGTLAIALLEWNNAFAGMATMDKIVQSFFNAVSPRTAGFSSVNVGTFSLQSLLLVIVLMVIGGGTQSTAGGLKVNVFAVVLLNLRAILYGENRVTAFNRQISDKSIRSSNSALILYLMFAFVGFFTLTCLEPEASVMSLVFETISALSTVGSSLSLTSTLGEDSKIVIVVLMFVGRVGVLTMASSLIKQHTNLRLKYPNDNIIIS